MRAAPLATSGPVPVYAEGSSQDGGGDQGGRVRLWIRGRIERLDIGAAKLQARTPVRGQLQHGPRPGLTSWPAGISEKSLIAATDRSRSVRALGNLVVAGLKWVHDSSTSREAPSLFLRLSNSIFDLQTRDERHRASRGADFSFVDDIGKDIARRSFSFT